MHDESSRKLWVCIRTYNESDETGSLINSLHNISEYGGGILIFDGGSSKKHLSLLAKYDVELYTLDDCKFDFGKSVNTISVLIKHAPFFLFSGHINIRDLHKFYEFLPSILGGRECAYFRQVPARKYNLYELLYLQRAFPDLNENVLLVKPMKSRFSNSACFYSAGVLEKTPIRRFGGGEEPIWLKNCQAKGMESVAYYSKILIEHSHSYSPEQIHKVVMSTVGDGLNLFQRLALYMKYRVGIFIAMFISGSKLSDANLYSHAHASAYFKKRNL
jgi:hypothetical protein